MDPNLIAEKLANSLKSTKCLDANAAVVALLRVIDQRFQVLFVKRAEIPTDTWSGQTALPGGKCDTEDRNLKETVVRETLEETGINLLEGCRFLGEMESFRSIQRPEMSVVPFVVVQEKEQPIVLNDELTGYFWATLTELVHNKGTVTFRSKELPAYIIDDHVIWGLTYRIVHKLVTLLCSVESK